MYFDYHALFFLLQKANVGCKCTQMYTLVNMWLIYGVDIEGKKSSLEKYPFFKMENMKKKPIYDTVHFYLLILSFAVNVIEMIFNNSMPEKIL